MTYDCSLRRTGWVAAGDTSVHGLWSCRLGRGYFVLVVGFLVFLFTSAAFKVNIRVLTLAKELRVLNLVQLQFYLLTILKKSSEFFRNGCETSTSNCFVYLTFGVLCLPLLDIQAWRIYIYLFFLAIFSDCTSTRDFILKYSEHKF